MNGASEYYALSKDDRWLEESPCSVGGRDTDIEQIAYSLASRIKEIYPINCVPEHIIKELDELTLILAQGDQAIDHFIGTVSKDRKKK